MYPLSQLQHFKLSAFPETHSLYRHHTKTSLHICCCHGYCWEADSLCPEDALEAFVLPLKRPVQCLGAGGFPEGEKADVRKTDMAYRPLVGGQSISLIYRSAKVTGHGR